MLPYVKAFQVSIGLSAASFLFLPFVRVGTQGHAPAKVDGADGDAGTPLTGVVRADQKAPVAVGEREKMEGSGGSSSGDM
jgi:hypothetical protein